MGVPSVYVYRTANKKLAKLIYWPLRKRSPKRLIVLVEPKKLRDTTRKFQALHAGRVPLSRFQIRVDAIEPDLYYISRWKKAFWAVGSQRTVYRAKLCYNSHIITHSLTYLFSIAAFCFCIKWNSQNEQP